MTRHVALVGPTASGKSALAMAVARERPDFELVSVDSMQVYRHMDIGTAKPSIAERSEVTHHGIDLVDPDHDFSLTQFVAAVNTAIADIETRHKRALLVGGTGLYLSAVIDDLEIPGQFPEVRSALEQRSTSDLYRQLQDLDLVASQKMEPDNRRRIVRALEVTMGGGRPFSSYGPGLHVYGPCRFDLFGLSMDRDVGRRLIDERVDAMMTRGLVDEVEWLTCNFELSRTARQALGYKEIIEHGPNGVELIKNRTHGFARRQRAWFRRDPRIRWFDMEGGSLRLLPTMLQQFDNS